MDLLAARLDGEVGPRAIDPGAVVGIARRDGDDAIAVARALNAGFVLTGAVIGSPSSIVVSAEYTDVSSGTLVASAEVDGDPEDISQLADRLVLELLSLSSGEYTKSIASLTSAAHDALRAYLLGKREWRAGRYPQSAAYFNEALAIDSTFALAAIACLDAGGMGVGATCEYGSALARRHRDRLGPHDLRYLEARLPGVERTGAVEIAAFERLTRDQPDRIEAWYHYGDRVFHTAGMFTRAEWAERVRAILSRGLELDPAYKPILSHLVASELMFAPIERLRELYRTMNDNLGPEAPVYMFEIADGGSQLLLPLDGVAALTANELTYGKWLPLIGIDHAPDDYLPFIDAILAEARRRASAGLDVSISLALNTEYDMNVVLGRAARAAAVREEAIREGVRSRYDRNTICDALWERIAIDDAATAAQMIDDRSLESRAEPLTISDVQDLVAAEVWSYLQDPEYTNSTVSRPVLAAAQGRPHPVDLQMQAYALLLDAWAQVREGRPATALEQMIEIIHQDPVVQSLPPPSCSPFPGSSRSSATPSRLSTRSTAHT